MSDTQAVPFPENPHYLGDQLFVSHFAKEWPNGNFFTQLLQDAQPQRSALYTPVTNVGRLLVAESRLGNALDTMRRNGAVSYAECWGNSALHRFEGHQESTIGGFRDSLTGGEPAGIRTYLDPVTDPDIQLNTDPRSPGFVPRGYEVLGVPEMAIVFMDPGLVRPVLNGILGQRSGHQLRNRLTNELSEETDRILNGHIVGSELNMRMSKDLKSFMAGCLVGTACVSAVTNGAVKRWPKQFDEIAALKETVCLLGDVQHSGGTRQGAVIEGSPRDLRIGVGASGKTSHVDELFAHACARKTLQLATK